MMRSEPRASTSESCMASLTFTSAAAAADAALWATSVAAVLGLLLLAACWRRRLGGRMVGRSSESANNDREPRR